MELIFFFYGLAFILMGIVIFTMPKKNDFLEIYNDIWLIGLFGITHGINEWIDLLILRSGPIEIEALKILGSIILPISFLFLVAFGGNVISKRLKQLSYLKYSWVVIFIIWAISNGANGHSVELSNTLARYFICIPGTILAAVGLSIAMKDCKNKKIPNMIRISTMSAIAIFILYGVLSGLVTSKAGFFPASIVNYDNFTKYIGAPVQLFRMFLAIFLTFSFIVMTSTFKRMIGAPLMSGGLKKKAGFIIAATTTVTILMSLLLIYTLGSIVIEGWIGVERVEIARALALTATENISREIEDAETYASRLLWIRSCETANLKYAGMSDLAIKEELVNIDKIWVASDKENKIVKEFISGEVADSMRAILQIRSSVSEIFLTDKFGGLVYASGKTSDFYQADEDWWQKAFNAGLGSIYFGPIEYDASSARWGSAIAVPVKNSRNELIGICKVFVQIDRFFNFLTKFKLGKTGHASLIDDEGATLLHEGVVPFSIKAIERKKLLKIKSGNRYFYANSAIHKNHGIIALSPIDSEALIANGITWNILIFQNSREALAVLTIFLMIIFIAAIFFVPLTIPIGLFLGGKISKPIDALSRIADNIAMGDLEQKINIHTGDEIEQFAETFKNMIFAIKASQSNLVRAKEDLEKLSVNQESLIGDRTKELSNAQEATLNILEDLVEAKNKLEKYSKDLEEAVQAKTDFTATVSHELRTPLAAIKEGIAIVLDGTAGPVEARQKEFLEIARRNVNRLARLINDLLDFQKLEAGRMEFNIKENDMNAAVKEVAEAMMVVSENKNLALKLVLAENLPSSMFDKGRIEQVLTNLIGNAIRYTDKGSIIISTEKKDNFIKVSVKDTGIGIKKEDMSRLFQRFSQLEPVSDRRVGGTGLGLAISKEIIDFHNGKMSAESEPGAGSTFSFILPIRERRGSV